MEKSADQIREEVSRAYGETVTADDRCCSGGTRHSQAHHGDTHHARAHQSDCCCGGGRHHGHAHEVEAKEHDCCGGHADRDEVHHHGGCCGSSQKGALAKLAGYSPEELADLPEDAVTNSFGCGNPLALAGVSEGDTVLDLGSGAGIDLLIAARKVGPAGRVIGIDMTDEMIVRAKQNVEAAGYTNVEVRKGIIEDLPVEDASVDWVISNCVINLSPEKPRVFREIARVLKPGGRMLVSDVVAGELPNEIRELAVAYSSCLAGAISEEEYLAGLKEVGLVDAEVRERLVYDASQLESLSESELNRVAGSGEELDRLRAAIGSVAGNVWSAKIYARKP